MTALLRITQIVASGGDIDVNDVIGKHECSDHPPSLFTGENVMYNPETKSTLVKELLKDNDDCVSSKDEFESNHVTTAMIVDAMHVIQKWKFDMRI